MQQPFGSFTGRGIKVAIIDSGVNPAHPHVGSVAGGVRITSSGVDGDYLDYNGHGTAVAGAIREKAPDALIYAVKIFETRLTTRIEVMISAIEWAIEQGVEIINMSLGTPNRAHLDRLERAAQFATDNNVAIVAAHDDSGQALFPGHLSSAIAVAADWDCPRDVYRVMRLDGRTIFAASPYPRSIPGVAPTRNLSGVSFSVANMAGIVARARQMHRDSSVALLRQLLVDSGIKER